jgi:3-methyladenine DNA glycosylase Tag
VAETIPEVIDRPSSADVLRIVTRAVFQAGVSWAQIASTWDAYERAFEGFDPPTVAAYGDADLERVSAEPGVLRMRRKVAATIHNARALIEIEREHGSFAAYAQSFTSYDALQRDLRERFSQIGEMSVWYVLFRCGLAVPRFEPWVATIKGEHPRMREMVDLARAQGRSPER